jgi:NAD(P)-dependent dehydrogenase (short-subunit alcohol dehydrogenase family)
MESSMAGRLAGKTALVIGAGSIGPGWGNGKATAVLFAREGARVMCVDVNEAAARETAELIARDGGEAQALHADASSGADVERVVEACVERFGHIDVLDNNVGIARGRRRGRAVGAAWDRVFAINLKSCFLAMKHVIPIMERQGGGSIVNISSVASIRYLGVVYATYYATKAAMNHLTRTTAAQYAAKNIRVNAILPGLMKTPMVEKSAGLAHTATRKATSRRCGGRVTRRSRWATWATRGTSRTPPCSSPVTSRGTSPASSSLSTAA